MFIVVDKMNLVPVGVSNHHVHLSKLDMIRLFGKEELEILRGIRQLGQFAAKETLNLIGDKGTIFNVRIVGPLRKETQVEIMRGDQEILGIKAPILVSGDLSGSPGITIQGPKGNIELNKGVIIAKIHVHLNSKEAEEFGLEDGNLVNIYFNNKLIIRDVVVRAGELHISDFHIDKEEAQEMELKNGDLVELRF